MNPIGFLLALGGLFSIVGAVCNWDWFMNHRKARFMTSIVGRGGARIFYIALGAILCVLGLLIGLGIIESK